MTDDAPSPTPAPVPAADPSPPPTPAVWHPSSPADYAAFALLGALVGAVLGVIAAYVTSSSGLELGGLGRWVPALAAAGAVEALLIGAVGVRRDPRVRFGPYRDASKVVGGVVGLMAGVALVVSLVIDETFPPWYAAGAAAAVATPLALRWIGWT